MTTEELLHGSLEAWNAHDRDRWIEYAADGIEVLVSGGVRASGIEGAAQLYDTWHEAFPDNRVEPTLTLVQGGNGMHESHFRGTHTGTMRGPGGDIPATGRPVDIPFVALLAVEGDELTSFRVYFDLLDMLGQLGLADSAADEPALSG